HQERPELRFILPKRCGVVVDAAMEFARQHIRLRHSQPRSLTRQEGYASGCVSDRDLTPLRLVVVHREMEKPGVGEQVYCTLEQIGPICRVRANPERERQGGIVPPPLRSWPLGRRPGRVATEPYPPPRPFFILLPPNDSGNDWAEIRSLGDSPR